MPPPLLALAVDCVVFGYSPASPLQILLIQRALPPFQGQWALPGGFVRPQESLEAAARRELRTEAGLGQVYLEQLYSFGQPERDPRQRVVSVAYYALVCLADHPPAAASDAQAAAWFALDQVPALAFDHGQILTMAHQRLQAKLRYAPIGFELLPAKFTLTQLQHLYETVLQRSLDKRNFRSRILKMNILTPLPETQQGVPHRAARLYRFDPQQYGQWQQQGFTFQL